MVTKRITRWIAAVLKESITPLPNRNSLDNYPSFLFNNYSFNWRIVVSDHASESDLKTAYALLEGMEKIFPGYLPRRELIRKAGDSGDYKNLILVGRSPVYAGNDEGNPLMDKELLHRSPTMGQGLIEFQDYPDGHFRLIVTGYSEFDVRKSGEILANPIKYRLHGKKVIVKGEDLNGLEIKVLQENVPEH